MSLVKVLFEELRPAIDCINDLDHQTIKAKLDQHFMLFNYEKKGLMKDTHWVATKIAINGLYLNLYTNKHRINHEYVRIE